MDPGEFAQQWQQGQDELKHDAAKIAMTGLATGAAAWLWQNRGRFQGQPPPQAGPQQPYAQQPPQTQRPLLSPVGVAVGVVVAFLCVLYLVFFIQTF